MKKDLLIIGFVILIACVLISGTEFQSVEEYYLTHAEDITPESETVTLSVDCSTILNNMDKLDSTLIEYVPGDGVILAPTKYVLRNGDTAFDILKRGMRYNKIHFEFQGRDKNQFGTAYIQGINYLYEFSCGELSGWIFKINGEVADEGCDKYILMDGDVVEFVYTCDLGRDIK